MDEDRILKVLDELDTYMDELKGLVPKTPDDYAGSVRNRRACERLLQISIESVINVSSILVKELKLGTPSDEDDIFQKLRSKSVISEGMLKTLKGMKGFRNILVHRYGEVDDALVFDFLKRNMKDFADFKKCILNFLRKNGEKF